MIRFFLFTLAAFSFTITYGQFTDDYESLKEKIEKWYDDPIIPLLPEGQFITVRDLAALDTINEAEAATYTGMSLYIGTEWDESVMTSEVPLAKFKNLEHLRVGRSNYAPFNFSGLTRLRTLHFDGARELVSISPSIGELVNLKNLYLIRVNKLEEIPKTVFALKNLQQLIVTGFSPERDSISRDIGNLVNLKKLVFSTCSVHLPAEIGRLSNLEEIKISNRYGYHVPYAKIYSLTGLKSLGLYVSDSLQFSGISQLTSLRLLFLNSKKVPEELGELDSLKALILAHNENISYPSSLGELADLEILHIMTNLYMTEAPGFIPSLMKLRYLEFVGCKKLHDFGSEYDKIRGIGEIHFNYNKEIRDVPASLEQVKDKVHIKSRG